LWKKEKITENKRKGREGKEREGKGKERAHCVVCSGDLESKRSVIFMLFNTLGNRFK
jgi:hypothetical protein